MPSESLDDAFVACVMPELHAMDSIEVEDPVLLGKGAAHPEVAKILNDFRDVLVSEIPGGLPPVRCDEHGQPIEHTIEVDPSATPFKRNPRPYVHQLCQAQ